MILFNYFLRFSTGLMVLMAIFALAACGNSGPEQAAPTASSTSYQEEVFDKPLPMAERKKVLILHSYHGGYQWTNDLDRGVINGLTEERFSVDKNIIIETFYMDTKRKTSKDWFAQISADAIQKIRTWKPDVVVASDDNAQKMVVNKMLDTETQFVFVGVNAEPERYGYIDSWENPGHNVTGAVERPRFNQSLNLLRTVAGDVKSVAIISDQSGTSNLIRDLVVEKAKGAGLKIAAFKQTNNFNEWKKAIRDAQDKADAIVYLLYFTIKDNNGRPVHPHTVMKWTNKNNRLPDIAFWNFIIEDGVLCSEAISGYEQGFYGGTLAAYILQGQKAREFPIGRPQRGELCFNTARARTLGLNIPPDLLRNATVYDKISEPPK